MKKTNPRNYGVAFAVIDGRGDRAYRERLFVSEESREKFIGKLQEKNNFVSVCDVFTVIR